MHPQSSSFFRLASIAQDLTHTGQSVVLDGIMKEVQALIDVSQHPNIVRFIGENLGLFAQLTIAGQQFVLRIDSTSLPPSFATVSPFPVP